MRRALSLVVQPVALTACLAVAAIVSRAQGRGADSGATIHSTTEVVNVYTVVRDRGGHLVRDLRRTDFQLSEDSVPQNLKYFSPTTDAPVTLALAIDTTACQDEALPIEKDSAKDFLQEVLRPGDRALVLHFGSQVEVLQGLTSDLGLLRRGIDRAEIEPHPVAAVPRRRTGKIVRGPHHLLDGVKLASNELAGSQFGLKVLVLLTDGYEQGSQTSLSGALDAAERADVIIYCIDVLDPARAVLPNLPNPGAEVLNKLAQQTGGRVFHINPSAQTPTAFDEIAQELRSQYFLGYTPSKPTPDGSFRIIRVRVLSRDYTVRARPGYYARAE